jgi:hypothetical protein
MVFVVHAPLAKTITKHFLSVQKSAISKDASGFCDQSGHLRDLQTVDCHLSNEHACRYAFVTCRYHWLPSLPISGRWVSMCSGGETGRHSVRLGAYNQIHHKFNGLLYAASGFGRVLQVLGNLLK